MKTITRAELSAEIKAGKVTVVDALPAAPFTTRHLPGAINLTIENIADAPKVLPDKDAAIVTYSSDTACTRGPELADALSGAGYSNVRNFTDGIADWAAAGLTLESGAPTASEDATDVATSEEATVRALVEKWAELERTQNADGFEGLITDQFTGIGPVGFVLDAQQWAGRHRSGDLVNHAFEVADINVAVYGDTAVAHAVETQRTTARGHENNGSFRVGLTFVRSDGTWKIASTQFSGPMIKPGEAPPFVRTEG